MSFLYPSFLFGLFTLAIPILLHLIQLRRAKRLVFSNVNFIKASKDVTASQRKLKNLLILLSRILFLLFLVLAFAQPYFPAKQASPVLDSSVSIVLDDSHSTQGTVNGKDITVFNELTDLAYTVADIFPDNTFFQVSTLSGSLDKSGLMKYEIPTFLSKVEQKTSLGLFASISNKPSHTFFLSDFQRSTFKPQTFQRIDTTSQFHLVPVKAEGVSNVAVDSVYLADEFIRSGLDNTIQIRLRNTSTSEVLAAPVKLFIAGNQIAALSIDIPANQVVEAELNFRIPSGQNFMKGYVLVEDYPVEFDNVYHFVLSASTDVKITEINGSDESLSKLYQNEPYFDYSSFTIGNINYADVAASDVVILNGVSSLPAAVVSSLVSFTKEGGTLLLIPPVSVESAYNSFFEQLNIGASLQSATSTKTSLSLPDPQQPFFSGIFSDFDKRMKMPTSSRSLLWSRSTDDILEFRGGAPYLSRFDRGKGSVYLIAAPLDDRYNELVNHALLVPVFYKIALSGYKQDKNLAYYFNTSTIQIPVESTRIKEGVYSLVKDSLSFIPEQQIRGGKLFFNIPPDLNEAGVYSLTYQEKEIMPIAFNYTKEESDLAQYTAEELRKIFKGQENIHVYEAGDAFSVKGEFEKRFFGVKLWKYCLILCLVFLMAEIALIRLL